jgi:hypothetical protein
MNEAETRAERIAIALWLNHTRAAALWSLPAWRVAGATHAMPVR